ncbi:MAG TPA: cytochrome c3 family protein [Pyrinomonadaceae bacterium]
MKLVIILLLLVVSIGVVIGPTVHAVIQEKESKTQPKELTLAKDSQSDKYGEVAFNHENHATKKYSVDGNSVLSCVECHHTDQQATALKAPLKTSERDVALTAAVLATADAKPVKSCRTCHLQAGDDSGTIPTVPYPDKPAPTKVTNEIAYHVNCNVCHDRAIAARPALKGKAPGSNDCVPCHKAVG